MFRAFDELLRLFEQQSSASRQWILWMKIQTPFLIRYRIQIALICWITCCNYLICVITKTLIDFDWFVNWRLIIIRSEMLFNTLFSFFSTSLSLLIQFEHNDKPLSLMALDDDIFASIWILNRHVLTISHDWFQCKFIMIKMQPWCDFKKFPNELISSTSLWHQIIFWKN